MTTDIFDRIRRIDLLIRMKGTGTAAELAERLGISRAQVYEYINLMKGLGAPIKYCKYRQSYFYNEEGKFYTCFIHKDAAVLEIPQLHD
ncbi:HTH domain-containing protein [Chitinophaga agri]|uniref:HTH domain-containing protein n=1 Tax=Chitinophaga agri TaxID=2703787 RepID=A0A6B9ZJZ1_9BACT|nr:HTH domain-containing protein [Chitinophaga agri]QHS61891.1 HTH domain-containing protein [Chitinophaga agri]